MSVYKIKPNFKMSLKIRKPSFKRRSKFSDSNPCQSCLTRIFTKYTPFCSTSCSLERFMQPFVNGNVFFFLLDEIWEKKNTQLIFTGSKSTIETLEKGVKYAQS